MRRRSAADRRHRGGRLRRRLARAEGLQRRRDPGQGRHARAAPRRPSRRSRRHATAAISRPRSTGSSSARSICPTAIRSAPRSSTTSSAGWSGCGAHAAELLARRAAGGAVPATGTSFPRTATSSRSGRRQHDALMQPETRAAWRRIVNQGWTDALRAFHPNEEKLYTFWDYTAGCWQRDPASASTICCARPRPPTGCRAPASTNGRGARRRRRDHAPTWVELS